MSRTLWKQALQLYQEQGLIPVINESGKLVKSKSFTYIAPHAWVTAIVWPLLDVLDRKSLRREYGAIFTYGSAETTQIKLPASLHDHPQELAHVAGEHHFTQPFLTEIKNAWIPREHSVVLTPENQLVLDTLGSQRYVMENYLANNKNLLTKILLTRRQPQKHQKSDEVIELGCPFFTAPYGVGYGGYAGWIQHFLPRLEAIKEFYRRTGERPKLIVNHNPPEVYIDSISTIAPEFPIYEWNPEKTTHISRALIPSIRRIETLRPLYFHRIIKGTNRHYKSCAPGAYQWLQSEATEQVTSATDNTCTKNIYISRADVSRRQVANRDELLNELRKYGFETVELTSMEFAEQIKLFAEADTVVAPHGAGLANIVFGTDLTVIELFGRKIKPTFYMLAEKVNHDYGYVLGDPVPNQDSFRVNPSTVCELLENLSVPR